MANKNIRNFCIIAHIDHGKSTLSDRILELTQSVDERTMSDQILDNMDIERERGITIKARAVTMHYTARDGQTYELNLIDTPGHVDFAYEVSRSLAACEGAILVVDATQGVEAQTLANTYMALEHDLELVPVLNKIDLPSAHPDEVAQEVEDVIGLPCMDAPRISAKTGLNIDQVLERVVADIPAPTGDPDAPLKALIFDSVYDSYKGVIVYIRVFEGTVKPGDTIRMMATGARFTLVEVGHMGATSLSPLRAAFRRGGGLSDRQHQDGAGHPGGRHRHPGGQPHPRGPARLPPGQAHGVLRRLPRRRQALSRPEGCPGKAAAERRLPDLRARKQRGPGLRLPVRLFGPSAHGDHHRAAGAGVRPRPCHHHPRRPVPDHPHRRGGQDHLQPLRIPRPPPRSPNRKSPLWTSTSTPPTTMWAA